MIDNLKRLYVAITENKVVLFDTNLRKFSDRLTALEPEVRNYDYLYREFKKSDVVEFTNSKGVKYFIQKAL